MNNNLFTIYKNNETAFLNLGLAVISNPYDIELKKVFNGEDSLSFSINKNSSAYNYLKVGHFIKAYDTIYIIRTIEEISTQSLIEVTVFCEHMIYELIDTFVPFFAHQNSTVKYMLDRILTDTRFKGTSNITGGYNLQVSKGSKFKQLVGLADNADALLVYDNLPDTNGYFNVQLVSSQGQDKGYLVHSRKNLANIKRILDGTEVITRLYAYGEEDLGIESVNGGVPYLDAENINEYPRPKEGSVTFETVNDAINLKTSAKKYLERVSLPKVTYEVEMSELQNILNTTDSIQIGDIITVIDEDLSINVKVKVSEITIHPITNNTQVVLDEAQENLEKLIAGIINKQETATGVRKGNAWLEWSSVPFTNELVTIYFSQRFKTQPVVNVEIYNANGTNTPSITILSQLENDEQIYTGITVHIPTGTGTNIAMQAIGRV